MTAAEGAYNGDKHNAGVETIKRLAEEQDWDLCDIIEALTELYRDLYEFNAAYEINNGMCEDFAEDLAYLVPGARTHWNDELEREGMPSYNAHKVVKIAGRYYDSECSDGVDNWQHLPFFVRDMAYLGYPG
jgi:hypothetical protein